MKFRPLQDWAVIQQMESHERTPGGIYLPDTAKEKPAEGVVLAIGPGRYKTEKKKGKKEEKKFVPTSVKPGQRVMYVKYMTTEVELDGAPYLLVREEHILGTVEGPAMAVAPTKPGAVMTHRPSPLAPVQKKAEAAPPEKKKQGKKAAPKKRAAQKKTTKAHLKKSKKVASAKKATKKPSKKASMKGAKPKKKK